ncbi:MAG: MoxR family ATPase [Deltaproteobacteria bacterium]|nr:MoxR family ATPase [Deltaproteobacteria bacterium]
MKKPAFGSTERYVASTELSAIVDVAVVLGRPLLIKGEPGTGKTQLAHEVARSLGKPFFVWNIKSTSKAREGLYTYDTVARLNDSRFGDRDIRDIRQYIKLGPLGQAFASHEQSVLLIDEIDKAELEFPNDLLQELDEMSFDIPETGERIQAKVRPIVIITSNAEKELPDAFLRRCVFHYIAFPEPPLMEEIVRLHHPGIEKKLLDAALRRFYEIRDLANLRKKPSTSELIDWLQCLVRGGLNPGDLEKDFPYLGVLLKKQQDQQVVQNGKASGY